MCNINSSKLNSFVQQKLLSDDYLTCYSIIVSIILFLTIFAKTRIKNINIAFST